MNLLFLLVSYLGCSKTNGTYGDPCGKSATYEYHEECAEGFYCDSYYPSFPRSHWGGDYCLCEDTASPDCDEPRYSCSSDEVKDCRGVCSPASWFGDGLCDERDRSEPRRYKNSHDEWVEPHFNCEELEYDRGDCDRYNEIYGDNINESN